MLHITTKRSQRAFAIRLAAECNAAADKWDRFEPRSAASAGQAEFYRERAKQVANGT